MHGGTRFRQLGMREGAPSHQRLTLVPQRLTLVTRELRLKQIPPIPSSVSLWGKERATLFSVGLHRWRYRPERQCSVRNGRWERNTITRNPGLQGKTSSPLKPQVSPQIRIYGQWKRGSLDLNLDLNRATAQALVGWVREQDESVAEAVERAWRGEVPASKKHGGNRRSTECHSVESVAERNDADSILARLKRDDDALPIGMVPPHLNSAMRQTEGHCLQ